MTRLIRSSAVAVAMAFTATAFSATETKEFDSKAIRKIDIENTTGKIKVTGGSETITRVTIEKVKFGKKCVFEIGEKGGELSIEVEEKGVFGKNGCEVNLTLEVPKKVSIEVSSGSGDLQVAGTEGELEYKLGSGDVAIDATVTEIDGISGSGSATIKGLTGEADLKSGSGDFNISYNTVPVSGELKIKSGSGNAKVSLPASAKVAVSSLTGSGTVHNQIGDTKDAAFKVSFRAGSGNLEILKQ